MLQGPRMIEGFDGREVVEVSSHPLADGFLAMTADGEVFSCGDGGCFLHGDEG